MAACKTLIVKCCLSRQNLTPRLLHLLNLTEHEISTAHKTKIPTNVEASCVKSLRCCIIMLINVEMPTIFGIFNIYKQDKFRAQLS